MNATAEHQPVTASIASIPHWIDGKSVAGSGRASPIYNPSLGRVIREVNLASKAEVERVVARCFDSRNCWTVMPSALRA
jgi:malonate-semialdehyde dehydrogenase (acetylating) / methylmalonate-semialdehyde dehydrogenase